MDERERDFLAVIGYVYLQHGDADSAADILGAVLVSRPHDRDVARALAYAHLRMGRFQECLELTDFLLAGEGRHEPRIVWLMRSRALLGLDRREQARDLWERKRQGVTKS